MITSKKFLVFIVLFFSLFWVYSALAGPVADIYIMAGQSNAFGPLVPIRQFVENYRDSGYFDGFLTETPENIEDFGGSNDSILFTYDVGTANGNYADGVADNISSDLNVVSAPLTPLPWKESYVRFGPELSFLKTLMSSGYADKTHQPVLVKVAFGSSSLMKHWIDDGIFHFKQRLADRVESTISELQAMGYTVNIKTMLWSQGESDIMYGVSSSSDNRYFWNLKKVISAVRNVSRERLGVANFKVVLMRTPMVNGYEATSCNVRCAQQQVAIKDAYTSLISADSLIKKDCFHFTSDGSEILGERFFVSYVSKINKLADDYCDCDGYTGKYNKTPLPPGIVATCE